MSAPFIIVLAGLAALSLGQAEPSQRVEVDIAHDCAPNQLCVIRPIQFTPDGSGLVAVAGSNLYRLDPVSGAVVWTVQTPRRGWRIPAFIRGLDISTDGAEIFTVGDEPFIRVWDARTGAEMRSIEIPNSTMAIALHPDGESAVVTTRREFGLVSLETGDISVSTRFPYGPTEVDISANGERMVAGSLSNRAALSDTASGAMIAELEGHRRGQDQVHAVFSPDGDVVVTAGEGPDVVVWNAETGAEIRRFELERAGAAKPAFSPDGRFLAIAEGRATVKIVSVETGAVAHQWDDIPIAASIAWRPDGSMLAFGVGDRDVRFVPAPSQLHRPDETEAPQEVDTP